MFVIWGSRMYGIRNVVRGFGECEHCQCFAKHKSYEGRKMGHLYYIPLIPMGGRVRVVKECAACDMGSHIPVDELPGFVKDLKDSLMQCVETVDEETHEFQHTNADEPVPVGPFLRDTVDTLYALDRSDVIKDAIQAFNSLDAKYESEVTQASLNEVSGIDDQAIQHYLAAQQTVFLFPTYALASIYTRSGQFDNAIQCYHQITQNAGESIDIYLEMTVPLESAKRFDELCQVLERCFEIAPELKNDKKLTKYYKKYAKKAKRASVV